MSCFHAILNPVVVVIYVEVANFVKCFRNELPTGPFLIHDSWLITGFVIRLTRRVTLVRQVLLTLPEHLNSPPVIIWVRVIRSLVLCVCFVDCCLSFCTFSFGHCVFCSSIYGFWLPFWYRQTLLIKMVFYLLHSRFFEISPINSINWVSHDLDLRCLLLKRVKDVVCIRMCHNTTHNNVP